MLGRVSEQERIRQWLLETVRLMVDRPQDVTVELKSSTASQCDLLPIRRFVPNGRITELKVPIGAHAEVFLGYTDDVFQDHGYWEPGQTLGTRPNAVAERVARRLSFWI